MALPAGVTTATVVAGVPVTHTGSPVKTFVSIEPSVFLVHAATGTPLVDFMEEMDISEGVAGQFVLPHTDQSGFHDENGNAYTNWYYTARLTYSTPSKAKNKAPKIKVFQLTTGQVTVDLDLLPGGAPALPYIAPTAQVTSFGGRVNAVTLQESDLPERLTDASLSATYDPIGAAAAAAAPKLDSTTAAATYSPLTVSGKTAVRKGDTCINVLDYGAVADGNLSTGAGTDNTSVFNTAIATSIATNKPLYIPAGNYRTTDMLDLRGARTYGDGMARTNIMCTDNVKAILLAGGGAFYLADLSIRHFSIPSTQTVPDGVGIRIQKLQDRSVIERVQIYNVTSGFYCYEPYSDTTNYMFSTTIRDCRVDRFTHSIGAIKGYAAGCTGNVFTNIYAQNGNGDGTYGTSSYGWQIGTMTESQFNNCNVEWGYYAIGFDISESSNLLFNGIHFEQYRAKGSTFSAFFNVYGSSSYTLTLRGITLKDCIFDQANVVDYALMRTQAGTKITWDGLVCTGSTVIGSVTRRKFIFSPVGAQIKASSFRLPDANFQTADFYQTAVDTPGTLMGTNPLGDGFLYEESEALKWMTKTGKSYTVLGGETTSTSSNYTATAKDAVVLATGGAGGITVTLPAAIKGGRYKIKKVDAGAGAVTVATTSSQTIDGTTTKSLAAQYNSLSVVSDGTAWYIV